MGKLGTKVFSTCVLHETVLREGKPSKKPMFLGCTFINIMYLCVWGGGRVGGVREATLMVNCQQQKLRKRNVDHLIEGDKEGVRVI